MVDNYVEPLTNIDRAEENEKLNKIAREINKAADLDKVLELILQAGTELLNVSYGDLWLVDKQTGNLKLKFSTHRGKSQAANKIIKAGQGVCGWVVKNKKRVIISDVDYDKRYLSLIPGMKSELALPLFFGEDVIGVMDFETEEENAFSGYKAHLMEALTEHAVIAIRNTKLRDRVKGFRDIDKAILDSQLDLQKTLSVLTEKGLDLLEAREGQILLFDGKETLEIAASKPKKEIGRKISIHKCVSGKAVKEKKLIHIKDVSKEDLYFSVLGEEGEKIVSEIAAPIMTNSKGQSVMGVFNVENSHGFSEGDKNLLITLTGQAAIAIKNAQLVIELKQTNKMLTAFKEIDEAIVNPDIDFKKTMEVILKNGLHLLNEGNKHPLSGQILLKEEKGFVIQATIGGISKDDIDAIGLDKGVCGHAAKTEKPLIIPNVKKCKFYLNIINDTKSELAFPLLDQRNRVMGIFNAESPDEDFFNEEHLHTLEGMKNQIIMAIKNAALQEGYKQLGDILSDINAAENLGETLDKILDAALRLIGVPHGQLLEVDEKNNEMEIKTTRGIYDKTKAERIPIGEKGVSSWVVKNKEPIRIPDVSEDIRYIRYLKDMKSELAVPLMADGKVIGIINIESPHLDFFTDNHETMLKFLANGAAMAMKNARHRESIMQMEILKNMRDYNDRLLHWIGNKAVPVHGCISRISEDIEGALEDSEIKESVMEDLEMIRKNSALLVDVKTEFAGVTREFEIKPINLAGILEENLKRKNIPAEIVHKGIEENLPRAMGSQKQLDIVLSNLLQNALDAMEGQDEKRFHITLEKCIEKSQLILKISDNGSGIKRKDLEKVFLPFFTTKSKGVGIGLSISYEIIKAMRGEMSVESEEQRGTMFTIKLPVAGV
jgi:putative methionine-R-sulfoxide reductase with GAF domain